MHLIVDAIPQKPLGSCTLCLVTNFLQSLPTQIGMTIIWGPQVLAQGDNIYGVVIIAESHISVHATPQTVLVDIFSCRDFDYERAREITLRTLHLEEVRSQVIPRLTPEHLNLSTLRHPFELPLLAL